MGILTFSLEIKTNIVPLKCGDHRRGPRVLSGLQHSGAPETLYWNLGINRTGLGLVPASTRTSPDVGKETLLPVRRSHWGRALPKRLSVPRKGLPRTLCLRAALALRYTSHQEENSPPTEPPLNLPQNCTI